MRMTGALIFHQVGGGRISEWQLFGINELMNLQTAKNVDLSFYFVVLILEHWVQDFLYQEEIVCELV